MATPACSLTVLLLAACAAAAVAAVPGAPVARPAGAGAATAATPTASNTCFTVADYWPYKTCRAETAPEICKRGWGAWPTEKACCTAGAAFPDGCSVRPKECWVVESAAARTCMRDDRKCLQGYGVWASQAVCCSPGVAFPDGCAPSTPAALAANPCWVVDTYSPARLCRSTRTAALCSSGSQSWATKAACCAKGGAFAEGCSAPAPLPCYTVDSFWPLRRCARSDDVAVCNRGWGVYGSKDVCCAPNVGFPEGCSPEEAGPAAAAAVTAGSGVRAPTVAVAPAKAGGVGAAKDK